MCWSFRTAAKVHFLAEIQKLSEVFF